MSPDKQILQDVLAARILKPVRKRELLFEPREDYEVSERRGVQAALAAPIGVPLRVPQEG